MPAKHSLDSAGLIIAIGCETMADEIIRLMLDAHRHLRHDIMNEIQVISGYLQLGQAEKALEYTKKAALKLDSFLPLGKISLPYLQSFFVSCLTYLYGTNKGFHLLIEDDLSSWQESDQLLAQFMAELIGPLLENLCRQELEIWINIRPAPAVEIVLGKFADRDYFKRKAQDITGLSQTYRPLIAAAVRVESGGLLHIEIEKVRKTADLRREY